MVGCLRKACSGLQELPAPAWHIVSTFTVIRVKLKAGRNYASLRPPHTFPDGQPAVWLGGQGEGGSIASSRKAKWRLID